jgi:hypothetical protein
VLVLGRARKADDQAGERLALQVRVGIDGYDERCVHACERGVQGVVLALLRLEDPPVAKAQAPARGVRERSGVVRRVVVRDHDFDPPVVHESGHAFERPDDRLALVPGRDQDRDRRPSAFRPAPAGRIQRQLPVARDEQREDHESDDERRDVRQEHRDHPRQDRSDGGLELGAPGLRHPDRERDPREGEREGE